MRRNLSETRICPGIEIGINSTNDPTPVLDAPTAAVLSALGQTSHLMHRAELGFLDDKEYSAYLNSSIIQSKKPTA